jgi:O-antigen/teichoic acid export membrane protein
VLAKIGTPEFVGQYALALAISGPVMFFCNLQLRAILASDAGYAHGFSDYWRLRVLTAPLAWLVVIAVAFLGRFGLETAIVIAVAGAVKSLETLSDICYGASQRDNRLDLVGKSLSIKGLLSIAAMSLAVWASQSVAFGIACVGVVWAALLLAYDIPNVRCCDRTTALSLGYGNRKGSSHWRLLTIGFPLACSITLLSITISLPSLLVERFLGAGDLGIYAALTSLAWAGTPLINALGQIAMPRFGQLYVAGQNHSLRRAVTKLAGVGTALGAIGILFAWIVGDYAVAILFGEEYSGRADVLVWLMVAVTILYASRFVADALTAVRCTRVQWVAQGASALVVLLGGIAVLPSAGLNGMAAVLSAALALRGTILVAFLLIEASPHNRIQQAAL